MPNATAFALNPSQDRILRPRELAAYVGLSLATLWRLRRAGALPQPIRLSANCVGWRTSVVDGWLAQRAAIRIEVIRSHGHVRFSIEDSGPGMKDEDMARCGERFFRVLGSGESGSGLGWSIVRRIAAVQQATVTIGRSRRLGGLAVDVEWAA